MRRGLQYSTTHARESAKCEDRLLACCDRQKLSKIDAAGLLVEVKRRRRGRRGGRNRNKSQAPTQSCGKPAGLAHFEFEERFDSHDYLGSTRESTSKRAPEVQKDRPQHFLPHGKKPAEPQPLMFVDEE